LKDLAARLSISACIGRDADGQVQTGRGRFGTCPFCGATVDMFDRG